MEVEALHLSGLVKLMPRQLRDNRGVFWETWRQGMLDGYTDYPLEFVQENLSVSKAGTLRGLHFQRDPHAQGKLVRCSAGRVFDVAVDVRASSPTRGQWFGCELSSENGCQLWIPAGFAHGFLALCDDAVVEYRCTAYYHPESEGSIRWDDPDINIDWHVPDFNLPEGRPLLSPKDAEAPTLKTTGWPFA
ncbi:MAG: dTDP-4-dehydrorhamnose 3,5-epimerase [Bacteroidota bacterium]|nr:dTDP-4-dehydrorhamnose 3,5-epimerase [Bacteroidota bacterium]